jgi:hypothetical protein
MKGETAINIKSYSDLSKSFWIKTFHVPLLDKTWTARAGFLVKEKKTLRSGV